MAVRVVRGVVRVRLRRYLAWSMEAEQSDRSHTMQLLEGAPSAVAPARRAPSHAQNRTAASLSAGTLSPPEPSAGTPSLACGSFKAAVNERVDHRK